MHAKPSPYGNLQGVYVSIVVLHLDFENQAKCMAVVSATFLLASYPGSFPLTSKELPGSLFFLFGDFVGIISSCWLLTFLL